LKLNTDFHNIAATLPTEGSSMFWERHYFTYAETVILVHMQFLKMVSTLNKIAAAVSAGF